MDAKLTPTTAVAKGWRYNESCDVYSFGIILWEMISCRLAFGAMEKKDFMSRIIERDERPPISSQTPANLAMLLRKCFSWNSGARPTLPCIEKELQNVLLAQDTTKQKKTDEGEGTSFWSSVVGVFPQQRMWRRKREEQK